MSAAYSHTIPNRVVAAMSGGVDSSVAALLLHRQGYDVIGVTMKLYDIDQADLPEYYRGCCTLDDVEDARAVCRILGIPHYVLNVQREFRAFVIDYFRREYENGRTPHPCIACNDKIKFSFLAQRARMLQAAYVATGHYARIEPAGPDRWALRRGVDADKDQSYVLFGMRQDQLAATLMPVGHYPKSEIRRLARTPAFPTRTSRTARTFASFPPETIASFCASAPMNSRATSWTRPATCWAPTKASSILPWVSDVASGFPVVRPGS